MSPEFLERLLLYPWPYNVRELDATIRKVVALQGEALGRYTERLAEAGARLIGYRELRSLLR